MKIRFLAILLALVLCLSAARAEGLTREELYTNGIDCLWSFDSESLEQALAFFSRAGNYKLTQEYIVYTGILYSLSLAEEDMTQLDEAVTSLNILVYNERFSVELADKGFPSCEELLSYINARKLELAGRTDEAVAIYREIYTLDSLQRSIRLASSNNQQKYEEAMRLFNAGKYTEAAEKFAELGNYANSAAMKEKALSMHTHDWIPATCNLPKTCRTCGKTSGSALGHSWQSATCTSPKTCTRCWTTSGSALGHSWQSATCTSPKTCTRCWTTSGSALNHSWQSATCTSPQTCINCGATSGSALGHSWQAATTSRPKTCSRCGRTEGSALQPSLSKGDVFNMGSWGGYTLQWKVLTVEGQYALVTTTKIIDCKAYNGTAVKSFYSSSLYSWLNNDFLYSAFSSSERQKIKNGEVTLLTVDQASRYFSSDSARACTMTDYAKRNGGFSKYDNWYWLVSSASDSSRASLVQTSGGISTNGTEVNRFVGGVRPALWYKIS